MLRTVLAIAGFAFAGYWAAYALTDDFQVWTAEGARRLEVALHPVAAPAVPLRMASGHENRLDEMLADGRGVTIVDFIYTRCTTVCLTLGSTFQQMQAALRTEGAASEPPRVRLLSISFDPVHDTPEALRGYAGRFGADERLWRFAAPRDADDLRRLLTPYQVTVIDDGLGGFEHNAALLVVDAEGRLVRIFDNAEPELALAYAQSIAPRTATP